MCHNACVEQHAVPDRVGGTEDVGGPRLRDVLRRRLQASDLALPSCVFFVESSLHGYSLFKSTCGRKPPGMKDIPHTPQSLINYLSLILHHEYLTYVQGGQEKPDNNISVQNIFRAR